MGKTEFDFNSYMRSKRLLRENIEEIEESQEELEENQEELDENKEEIEESQEELEENQEELEESFYLDGGTFEAIDALIAAAGTAATIIASIGLGEFVEKAAQGSFGETAQKLAKGLQSAGKDINSGDIDPMNESAEKEE